MFVKVLKGFVSLQLGLLGCCLTNGQDSLVSEGDDGRLIYAAYANRGETEKWNRIPDFSHCGYRGGGVELPRDLRVIEEIEASESDQHALIQAAIDRVSALPLGDDGFRGSILLKAGTHYVGAPLEIESDGVVLIGEGQDLAERGGTELVATSATKHTFITIGGGSNANYGSRKAILDDYVGTGSDRIRVEDVDSFSVGERIQVVMTPNDAWVEALGMDAYGWTGDGYNIAYERNVVGIEGEQLVLDSQIVQPLRAVYGGGYVRSFEPYARVRSCGIENMLITSSYSGEEDEEHGWVAVLLDKAEDCWVRNVTSRYFGYACVSAKASYHCTIEECAALDPISRVTGGRRYSFDVSSGTSHTLFQRCYTRGGRHDAVTGSRVPGPNVFLDFYIDENSNDPGPHHRYSTGILFDNLRITGSTGLRVQNRKDSGSGHGWAGAQIVFWNCKSDTFVCDAPPTAMNFSFGYDGEAIDGGWGPEEPFGHLEEGDPHVSPRSLYLMQLRDRLGVDALLKVADWRQLKGGILDDLKTWRGLGDLKDVEGSSLSLTIQDWLNVNALLSVTDRYSERGIMAGHAYLGGIDLVDRGPLEIEKAEFDGKEGVALWVQSRLGLRTGKVVLERSETLDAWDRVEASGLPLLSDRVLKEGVRQRRWFISMNSNQPEFFRLGLWEE